MNYSYYWINIIFTYFYFTELFSLSIDVLVHNSFKKYVLHNRNIIIIWENIPQYFSKLEMFKKCLS